MKFAKLALTALAPAAVLVAAPAMAAGIEVGATVVGPEGNPVGKIVSVEGDSVILDTGKHKVPTTTGNYVVGDMGPVIGVTKVQLNGMMDARVAQANAARDAALVVGAEVLTSDGQPLGTVGSIDGDNVVITRGEGKADIPLTRDYFSAGEAGLAAGVTSAQIAAAEANAGAM